MAPAAAGTAAGRAQHGDLCGVRRGRAAPRAASRRGNGLMARLPLEGLRVTDFCWIGAGSYATKILGDMGAEVIKVESSRALDQLRTAGPFKDKKKGVNRSGYFADRNTSKRSMTVDMKHPRALEVVQRLIVKTDIVA